MYQHVPGFVGNFGREAIWGLPLTTLNVAAMLGGLSVGRQIGAALHLGGPLFILQTLLWIVLGVVLTYEHHGLFVVRRALLRVAYARRTLTHHRTIDASAWIVIVEQDDETAPLLPGDLLGRVTLAEERP